MLVLWFALEITTAQVSEGGVGVTGQANRNVARKGTASNDADLFIRSPL